MTRNGRKIGFAASRYIHKNKNKKMKMSSKNLEDKFARMCLTPSQASLSQLLFNGYKKKKMNRIYRRSNTAHSVFITPEMYSRLKLVVSLTKHLETHEDDIDAQMDLEQAENCIDRFIWYRKRTKHLPPDWKYERANASILVDEWASFYERDKDDGNIII